MSMDQESIVSVIIPVYNVEAYIERCSWFWNLVAYTKNEKNLGLIASLNRALQHAQGKYVARMDADDISLPNRLQEEMGVMYKHNVDFVISSISFIDERDHLLATPDSENMNTAFFAEIMKYGNFSIHPTWLVKTKIYQDLHGYRELKYCEDYDFILRALEQGVTCYGMKKFCSNIAFVKAEYQKHIPWNRT